MHPHKESFAELVSLTKLFLFRENPFPQTCKKVVPNAPSSIPDVTPIRAQQHNEVKTPAAAPVTVVQKPVQAEEPKPVQASKLIKMELEPITKNAPTAVQGEMWNLCREVFPKLVFHELPPGDEVAKQKAYSWMISESKEFVAILAFQPLAAEMEFLQKIATGITSRFFACHVIVADGYEENSSWEALLDTSSVKLILIPEQSMSTRPRLKRYYTQEQGKHWLNGIPTFFLSTVAAYERDKKLKAYLWQSICNELQNHVT